MWPVSDQYIVLFLCTIRYAQFDTLDKNCVVEVTERELAAVVAEMQRRYEFERYLEDRLLAVYEDGDDEDDVEEPRMCPVETRLLAWLASRRDAGGGNEDGLRDPPVHIMLNWFLTFPYQALAKDASMECCAFTPQSCHLFGERAFTYVVRREESVRTTWVSNLLAF